MIEIQLKLEEKYAILNGVRLPRAVYDLLMKNERLLAINKYRAVVHAKFIGITPPGDYTIQYPNEKLRR